MSWEEPNVVRLDRTDAEDSSSWFVNGEVVVVSGGVGVAKSGELT